MLFTRTTVLHRTFIEHVEIVYLMNIPATISKLRNLLNIEPLFARIKSKMVDYMVTSLEQKGYVKGTPFLPIFLLL